MERRDQHSVAVRVARDGADFTLHTLTPCEGGGGVCARESTVVAVN